MYKEYVFVASFVFILTLLLSYVLHWYTLPSESFIEVLAPSLFVGIIASILAICIWGDDEETE